MQIKRSQARCRNWSGHFRQKPFIMQNAIIITQKGKPVALSLDGVIDWYIIFAKIIPNLNFDEWQSKGTIDGMSIKSQLDAFELKVWKWNQIQNDFIYSTIK